MPPVHHKEMAVFLRSSFDGEVSVTNYRDNIGNRPIPIGKFGHFFSTIGASDMSLNLPKGNFELSVFGSDEWLPNAITSSVYWLQSHSCDDWPLVCEDVVKDNVRHSQYRHMAFIPSDLRLEVSTGNVVCWLVGFPIPERDISISMKEAVKIASELYPSWLLLENA
ncbi:TPA: hypothetical protein ACPJ2O_004671 [Vibrio diabolicus]